jgi:dephospho-CoA kinase
MPKVRTPPKKQKKRFLAILGMPGSGKGEATRIAADLGFPVVSFGDVVRDEVKRRKLEPTPENTSAVADWFHKLNNRANEPIMVKRLVKTIPEKVEKTIILDGPRSPGQIRELKKYFNVKILAIILSNRIRWKRQLARGRADLGSMKDILARDKRELSYGIGTLIKSADYKISNNCTIEEFRKRVHDFLRNIS